MGRGPRQLLDSFLAAVLCGWGLGWGSWGLGWNLQRGGRAGIRGIHAVRGGLATWDGVRVIIAVGGRVWEHKPRGGHSNLVAKAS